MLSSSVHKIRSIEIIGNKKVRILVVREAIRLETDFASTCIPDPNYIDRLRFIPNTSHLGSLPEPLQLLVPIPLWVPFCSDLMLYPLSQSLYNVRPSVDSINCWYIIVRTVSMEDPKILIFFEFLKLYKILKIIPLTLRNKS